MGHLPRSQRPGSFYPPRLCTKLRLCEEDAVPKVLAGRGQLNCDGTCAETRFCLSAKRMSPFLNQRGGGSVQSTTGTAEVCSSAVVMLDTPCSEVV